MTPIIRNYFLALVFLGFIQSGMLHAQEQNVLVNQSTFTSTLLKKKVKLMVRVPDGYQTTKSKYTVLYLLHATAQTVEETALLTQKMHGDKGTPEMIIVGIEIGTRDIDGLAYNPKAKKFLSFMEQELIPSIEKKYRSNKQRILQDKSLWGSFPLYAFLTKPALFNGYIAASKQWYETNNNYFTGLANKALQNPGNFKGRKIFLATMNGAYNNNNIAEVDKQMLEFAGLLRTKSGNQISCKYQAYDDWSGVPQTCFEDGLLFVCTSEPSLTMVQNADGKWAILDEQKKELYEVFPYDNGPDYPSEGLIRVVKNGKIGYADANTFAVVIAPQFDCAFPFENGKAKVSNKCKVVKDGEHSMWESDTWQYVNQKGEFE